MHNLPLKSILSVALLIFAYTARADGYELGQGMQVGDFRFSGYTNLVLEAPHTRRSTLDLDDTGIFISGRVNRWVNPFIEAEFTRMTLAADGGGPVNHGQFIHERIYNEINVSDTDALRIGKVLAPVGDWNLIHAAPLVPIETRPLTTYMGFSEYSSGIAWARTGSGEQPDWEVYLQPGSEWLSRPINIARRQYRDVSGAHVSWSLAASDQFGLSYQHGTLISSEETNSLLGANARQTFGKWKVESEMTVARWSGGTGGRVHNTEAGIYALAEYALRPQWHVLLEAEYYRNHQVVEASKNTLVGIAYKPHSGVVWKLEYANQTGVSRAVPTGWQTSIAILF